jgi:hypothetical protein
VAPGRLLELLSLLRHARGTRQLQRLPVVVREQLRAVLHTVVRECLQPPGGQPVLLGTVRARNRAVRDVTHEHVEEGVFALSFHGGAPFAA